ncbi:hypothetical protein [Streptomyces sp. NPDC014006]|uniref:hypothetical protein n=1 Tax=Streptomyces sp. NPDC014006 TaxID=3364870 RepID=UPI0036F5EDDB
MPGANLPLDPASWGSRVKSQIGHALAGCHPSPVMACSPAVVGLVRVVLLLVGGLEHVGRQLGLRPGLEGTATGVGCAGEGGKPFQVLRGVQPRRRVGRTASQVLPGHCGLLMGLNGGGPLRRGERGIPARMADGVRRV